MILLPCACQRNWAGRISLWGEFMAYESLHAERQKRALNIVWTAAGKYGFRPEFLAFHQNGEPDLYLNSIVGLVHRHYDTEKLTAYLRNVLDKSLLGGLFTELFWLGLEEAVYKRELPARPVLHALRRQHAERFLAEDTDLFFQQLMMRQELAHNLKCARCREILGEKTKLINPWDRKLYEALSFSGTSDTDTLIAAMEGIIHDFFRWHWQTTPRKTLHFTLPTALKALMLKLLPVQSRYIGGDAGFVLQGGMVAGSAPSLWPGQKTDLPADEELTRRYGASLFSPERRAAIEGELCQGSHRQVRLWFTGEKGELQPENLTYFTQHQLQFRTELKELSRHLQNALQVHRQPLDLPSRSGRLAASRVWRGNVIGDSRVFSAREPARYSDFAVMLLLDASDSRQGRQAVVASQAYLIAEALRQAGIPLQATAFFSQGGCTVLMQLKDFEERSAQGIFAYKAQGWNRDGLALRAVPELWSNVLTSKRKLLVILTDANPSDDRDIPRHGLKNARLYGGAEAMVDTAQGVKELQKQGFSVLALVNSVIAPELAAQAARKIYGYNYICLHDLSDMAQKVGSLLELEIWKM